jgi:transcriptional regulator with XRE-family HTH domain
MIRQIIAAAEAASIMAPEIGTALRAIRRNREWTLAQAAERTGIPVSTLARIEKNQVSPSYHQLVRLSEGMEIDITQLFSPIRAAAGQESGRRSINRRPDGQVLETPREVLRYLSTDLLSKSFTPLISDIKARHVEEYGDFHYHPGEEFVYVIAGELELHTRSYAPLILRDGESIYFDSSTPHAYVAHGKEPCRILSICTAPHAHVAETSVAVPPSKQPDRVTPIQAAPAPSARAARSVTKRARKSRR